MFLWLCQPQVYFIQQSLDRQGYAILLVLSMTFGSVKGDSGKFLYMTVTICAQI